MNRFLTLECVSLNLAAVEGDDLAFDAIMASVLKSAGQGGYKAALVLNSGLLILRSSPERDGWCDRVRADLRAAVGAN